MRATVEVIERELVTDGLVRRWSEDPNGFLICSYWLVECLSLGGQDARARAMFDRVTALANDVGLLSEMADLRSGELLGNVPQAFSHAGLINAAWRLSETPG
jgi:GH15 family glucan-1,4-alpha-glucosidase